MKTQTSPTTPPPIKPPRTHGSSSSSDGWTPPRYTDGMSNDNNPPIWFYGIIFLALVIFVVIVKWISPQTIPFTFFELLSTKNFLAGIISYWPLYLWAFIRALFGIHSKTWSQFTKVQILSAMPVVCTLLGIAVYWICFFALIATAEFANNISFNIVQNLYEVFATFLSTITFHQLDTVLQSPKGWSVGFSALIICFSLRKMEYGFNKISTWIHSLIIHLALFHGMLTYGLLVVMIVYYIDHAITTCRVRTSNH